MSRLIGIGGRARAGKNLAATLLTKIAEERGFRVSQIAYADALKAEIDPWLLERYGISAWTQDDVEKAVVRPHLVELGARRRAETNGMHWIGAIDPFVKALLYDGALVFVTDCRYANEAKWLHELGGKLVYVERTREDGSVVPPANEEEARNDGDARQAADITLSWPTLYIDDKKTNIDLDKLRAMCQDVWNQLGIS